MKGLISIWLVLGYIVTAHAEVLYFQHDNTRLRGHFLPVKKGIASKGVIVFVHGDGPVTYDAQGYYPIIWHQLRNHGYAVFSWDKPGVGGSSGQWLSQSMQDRAQEVKTAIEVVQETHGFQASNTGVMGFSQAGWVLSELVDNNELIGFMIGVGIAGNWVDQGHYYTKKRLLLENAKPSEIHTSLNHYQQFTDFLLTSPTYSDYLAFINEAGMSKERYRFVLKNVKSDCYQHYEFTSIPTLLLWGENDLNVDAFYELKKFSHFANKNTYLSTLMISNANHGMLRSDVFNKQDFGFSEWIKLLWMDSDAFEPEFFHVLLEWLKAYHSVEQHTPDVLSHSNNNFKGVE